MNQKFCISIQISWKFLPKGPIDNKSALVQVMAWPWTAITWTNANPLHRRIYAALGGNELTCRYIWVLLHQCWSIGVPWQKVYNIKGQCQGHKPLLTHWCHDKMTVRSNFQIHFLVWNCWNLVITVSPDGSAPISARPSSGTVLKVGHDFSSTFLFVINDFKYVFTETHIQNGQKVITAQY